MEMTPVNPQEMTSVFATLAAPGASQAPGASPAALLPFAGLLQGLLPVEQSAVAVLPGTMMAGQQEPALLPKGVVPAAPKGKAALSAPTLPAGRRTGAETQELTAASLAQILSSLVRPESFTSSDDATAAAADASSKEQELPTETGKKDNGDNRVATLAETSIAVMPQDLAAIAAPTVEMSVGRQETRIPVEMTAALPRAAVVDVSLQERPAATVYRSSSAVKPQVAQPPVAEPSGESMFQTAEMQTPVVTDHSRPRPGESAGPVMVSDTAPPSGGNISSPQSRNTPAAADSQPAISATLIAPNMPTASTKPTALTGGAEVAVRLPFGRPLQGGPAPSEPEKVVADSTPAMADRTLPVEGVRGVPGERVVINAADVGGAGPEGIPEATSVTAVPTAVETVNPDTTVDNNSVTSASVRTTGSSVQTGVPADKSAVAASRNPAGAQAGVFSPLSQGTVDAGKPVSTESIGSVSPRTVPVSEERVKESTPGGMKRGGYDREERGTDSGKGNDLPQSAFVAGRAADAPVSARFLLEPRTEAAESKLHSHILEQVTSSIVTHDGKGNGTITVKLNPLELGELQVSVKIENQTVKVEIFTDNRTVREALLGNIESLKETFQKQNLTMERFDVSSGGSSGFSQGFREERGDQQRAQTIANDVEVPTVRSGREQGSGETEETENSLVNLRL